MLLGYVHNTGKIWKLWDFEQNRAIQCADVIFIEEDNTFTGNSGSNENYFNIDERTSECDGGQAVSRHHINEGTSKKSLWCMKSSALQRYPRAIHATPEHPIIAHRSWTNYHRRLVHEPVAFVVLFMLSPLPSSSLSKVILLSDLHNALHSRSQY
jgi:hypothetical protein